MGTTAIATLQPTQLERTETFAPRTISEAFQFADMILASGMAPKAYSSMKPEIARATVVVVIQFGLEVGLQPLQALQNISNINGNPAIWGDAALALCYAKPHICEYVVEQDLATIKKNNAATCIAKRRGSPEPVTITFTLEDAKVAGLLAKESTWGKYPTRMLMLRARGFALRNAFPDILKGLVLVEEAWDYDAVDGKDPTPKIQASVVVPTEDVKPVEAKKESAVESGVDQNSVVTINQAKQVFDAYKKVGKATPDFLEFGAKFDPPVTNSRQIKTKDFAAFMAWASTPKGQQEPPVSGNIFDAAEENQDADPA